MIHRAIEGETTWLQGVDPSDIPYPLPSGIRVLMRRDEIGLEPQGLAGAIPLLNGHTLQIVPKIGQVNFLRLLFRAEGAQGDLEREYEDFVSYSVEQDGNIDHIVARQLMLSAAEIMRSSPQRGRVKRVRTGSFALGQVDAVATALNIATRKQDPVVYSIREKTLDIPDNRVLTEAVLRAGPMLAEADISTFGPIRHRWVQRFPRSENLTSDLEHVERSFASGRYGGARDYYRRAMTLAQIVLGSSGLGFGEAAIVEGDSVLLNTSDIFERYLRNVIANTYSEAGYLVTKGGIGGKSLYTDGSYELKPDIVISKDGRTVLIADAKYKRPSASDHYQMHTYLAVHSVKRGLLLAPLYNGDKVVVREHATHDRTIVNEAYLPMDNLELTEDFLRSVVQRFS